MLLLLAASAAADEPRKFESLEEAEAAVLKLRAETLESLEKERLPIPEIFLEAEGKRHDAMRAWLGERWKDAHAAYESAWARAARRTRDSGKELAAEHLAHGLALLHEAC